MYYNSFDSLQQKLGRVLNWSTRLEMEAEVSRYTLFVTLTYNEEHIRENKLDYEDFQLFMKRVRRHIDNSIKVKYYVSGEYGEKKGRMHWHALFFLNESITPEQLKEFYTQIKLQWFYGFTNIKILNKTENNHNVFKYVTKYTLKDKSIEDSETNSRAHCSQRIGYDLLKETPLEKLKENKSRLYLYYSVFKRIFRDTKRVYIKRLNFDFYERNNDKINYHNGINSFFLSYQVCRDMTLRSIKHSQRTNEPMVFYYPQEIKTFSEKDLVNYLDSKLKKSIYMIHSIRSKINKGELERISEKNKRDILSFLTCTGYTYQYRTADITYLENEDINVLLDSLNIYDPHRPDFDAFKEADERGFIYNYINNICMTHGFF